VKLVISDLEILHF